MESLVARDVCRRYGSQKVLDGLSLTMAPGRFEALMGPSGSGKSTFLHIAAGLLSPDSGSVSVGGTEVTALSDSAAARSHLLSSCAKKSRFPTEKFVKTCSSKILQYSLIWCRKVHRE